MKRNRNIYFLGVIPLLFCVWLLITFYSSTLDPIQFYSLFFGFIFSTFNFVLGVLAIHFGFEKSDKIFLIIVFGGLVVRLFLMLILIVIALEFLFVRLNSFIFTTFIFYFYYLIVEIFILNQKKNFIIKTKQ
jgi:hypothetical protein